MNPQLKFSKYKRLSLLMIALTAIAGIVLFTFLAESNSKYFESSPLTAICYAVIVSTIAVAVLAVFFLKNAGNIDTASCARPKYLNLIIALAVAYVFFTTGKQLANSQSVRIWLIIAALTAFSLIYFTSNYVETNKTLSQLSGYLHILLCVLIIGKLYFDHSVETNAPLKLMIQFTACASALTTVNNLRASILGCNTARYAGSKLILISLASLSGIGAIYAAVAGRDVYSSDYWVFPALFFATAVLEAVEYFSAQTTDPSASAPADSADASPEASEAHEADAEATQPTELD